MHDQDKIIETFTELAPRYESVVDHELSRFWGWRYTDFADHLIASTPLRAEDRILDIATGTAVIPRKIYSLNNRTNSIHGLDITPAMLRRAQAAIQDEHELKRFCLTCASAMAMPYQDGYFDKVFCGLATHHMNARQMLSEMNRVLKDNGEISISDVGGSPFWQLPGIKFLLKIIAFIYYSIAENPMRAWAEAQGVSNIRTVDEWYEMLVELGFDKIRISRLHSKFFWIPKPVLIRANKKHSGG